VGVKLGLLHKGVREQGADGNMWA